MAIQQFRACSACHAAKVKCIKTEDSLVCKRCQRLGIKCVDHVSRQGQGTRRRKKVKTKVMENTVDEALAISTALSHNPATTPFCPTSGNIVDCDRQTPIMCPSKMGICQPINQCNHKGSINGNSENSICKGIEDLEIDPLEVEDSLLCKSITNGMSRDHFGLTFLIREWVSLAFSRRSFSLLARASYIASKMKISMDDIISNQSPFAVATDSQPMEFLARDLLLSKSERTTLGYPVDLQEVPWDLLESVGIDPNRANESVKNRWIGIRWTTEGTCRFWTSPLFSRDFANVDEVGQVFEANSGDKEVIDLFLPKSEKGKFAQQIFNLLFVNHKPNMDCFVIKSDYNVHKRNDPEPIAARLVQTMKLMDLDSQIHYFEIQFHDRTTEHLMGNNNINKREHADIYVDNINDDPLMSDGIAFTDIEVTEEMQEFLKLISGD